MSEYLTPGTYIEEINLPFSITAEPTDVTVFIGYTQKAADTKNKNLLLKPILIHSITEYELQFGTAANQQNNFCLYESVHLYFDNGGKKLYIISVGDFAEPVSLRPLLRGLNRSKTIEAPFIAIPDAGYIADEPAFYKLQKKILQICSGKENRFAVLDTKMPTTNIVADINNFRNNIGGDNLKWGAVYYPWLKLISGKIIPPSGAVCGVYVQVDTARGVWKAPANISLNGVTDVSAVITDATGQDMNVSSDGKSINAIRKFTGKGIVIWGARTLMGNDNEWRYVPVRRFFIMVTQSIIKGTDAFVFEPNDNNTWMRVITTIENFLTNLWRQGALQGAKTQEAFYVRCGIGTTMTQQDILEGRMIIEIGMATVRPAEFIILRVMKKMLSE